MLRILGSGWDYAQFVTYALHEIARSDISVAVVTPPTIHERDLLETAARQRWDLAVLMLNNILYSKGRRPVERMIVNARDLVRTMRRLFKKPIICLNGIDNGMGREVIEAGSECFMQVPLGEEPWEELKQTLKRHLPIW
jgi:hypothetical protein